MMSTSVSSTKTAPQTMMSSPSTNLRKPSRKGFLLNFVAGGIAGTTGVIITCPLDVVQTRLQSSYVKLEPSFISTGNGAAALQSKIGSPRFGLFVYSYMKRIVQTEGFFSLYKGLIPNLLGIAPSRAIYFGVYNKTKGYLLSTHLANSSATHMLSALSASWTVSTMTNPIWFLKTKIQLDLSRTGLQPSLLNVIKEVFKNEGVLGFYRGLFASYVGASETMIYFVLYERLKMVMGTIEEKQKLSVIDYVCSAFVAKSAATIAVYPHEVARTRLREESVKNTKDKLYKGFFQTMKKVYREEGRAGLYGGMGAHLMRQVPNTVIMFLTYESIVNFLAHDD